MPAVGPQARRSFLDLGIKVDQHRLHGAHHEWNADEDHGNENADRRERDLDSNGRKRRAEPAFFRKQRGQRHAGDCGRQCKGNIDDGVEQPPARETIAHQRPDDDRPHHQIDEGGGKGEGERNLERVQRAATGENVPELIGGQLKRLQEQRCQRYQDDDGKPGQGQA